MFKEEITQYCKNCFELAQQLDQLKAENKELKEWREKVVNLFNKNCRCKYLNEENAFCSFYNKKCIGAINQCLYKNQQTLAEISNIVQVCCKTTDCKKCKFFEICENNCVDVILQKIREVEDANN